MCIRIALRIALRIAKTLKNVSNGAVMFTKKIKLEHIKQVLHPR